MANPAKSTTRRRSRTTPAILAAICFALSFINHFAHAQIPRGVFCLLPAGGGTGDLVPVFNSPDVDGISVRQNWSALEPREGAFDWSYLDAVVAKARAAGKPVLLRIGTQANKPDWVNTAVTKAGGTFFTYDNNGTQTTIPVFWDPTYLAKKTAMIRALGAHFANHRAVEIVSVSFANADSEDWNVPHENRDITNWLAAGYTSQKMLDAAQQIIDTTMLSFPNQYVTLAVGGNGHTTGTNLDLDRDYVARNAIIAARQSWPGRLIVQKYTVSATVPKAPGAGTLFQILWDSAPDVAGQMLHWCYQDNTYRNNDGVPADASNILRQSADTAVEYGMKFLEIYQTDIANLAGSVHYAHNALTSAPLPTPTPAPSATPAPTIPRGVFCLLPVGGGTGSVSPYFNDPDVDGISIRQNWSELEPVEGAFKWAYLDTVVAKAAAARKPVLLRISSQANKPDWVNTAVAKAGGKFFTFNDNGVRTTIPVFWDPTYLAKKTAMIRALGAHFAGNPWVRIVSASFANSASEDWAVPHSPQDVANLLALGYTSQKMLDAGKLIIDTTMTAFPDQYVTMAVGCNGHVGGGASKNLDPDTDYLARNTVLNARESWPGRFIVQKYTLCATTPAASGKGTPFQLLWDSRPDVAGQMLYWSYAERSYRNNGGVAGDPSAILRKSIDRGLGYQMKFIEIYQKDVVNFPNVTHYAHTSLAGP